MVFGEKPEATQILNQGWCFEGAEPCQDIRLNTWVWTRDSQNHTKEMSRHRGNPQVKAGSKKGFVLKQLKHSLKCAWDGEAGAEGWIHHGTLQCPVSISLSESCSQPEPWSCWSAPGRRQLCSRGPGRHCCQSLIPILCGIHLTFNVMPTAALLWNQEWDLSSFGETRRKFQSLRHRHLVLWAAKRQPAPISVFKSSVQLFTS